MPSNTSALPDSALTCVVLMAQFYEKAVNPQHLVHELGTSAFSHEEILRAFKLLELKARQVEQVTWERLQSLLLPALAQRSDGKWVVLAKVANGKILLRVNKHPRMTPPPQGGSTA